jgi:pimeloyl-ACP methyl ester carboxylesterase
MGLKVETSASADGSIRLSQLVLLPGLVCDAAVWAHARAALGARSEVAIAEYGTLDSLGAMAEKVLRETHGPFAIAGHSMGGRIALEIYRCAPERITGIALMDTGAQPLAAGGAGEREAAGRHELLNIARTEGMAAMAARWVSGMVWPPRLQEHALISSIVDMFARSSADVFAAQIRALLARPDASELLPRIACPALVLCGAEDSWAPAARHREMAAKIPGARLTLVPECGHMCTLERPEAVTAALLEWQHSQA